MERRTEVFLSLLCKAVPVCSLTLAAPFGFPQSNKLASTLLWDFTFLWHHAVTGIQPQPNLLSQVLCQISETCSWRKREGKRRESEVVNFGGIVSRSQFNSKFFCHRDSVVGSGKGEWCYAWSPARVCVGFEVSQGFDLPLARQPKLFCIWFFYVILLLLFFSILSAFWHCLADCFGTLI